MNPQKVILITGTSSGFGRLMALALARRGHFVFASMRDTLGHNASRCAELRALAQNEKCELRVLELDVTNQASIDGAVGEVIKCTGRLDVLVNNAGFSNLGLTEAFTLDQAKQIFETNFFGALRMNRAVLPHMRRRRSGLMIHISSGAGRLVVPSMALYCASKFALEALAEAYRYELSGLGVDSVIVEPGPYPTGIVSKFAGPEESDLTQEYGSTSEIPAKMLAALTASQGDPTEVADAVVKLIETEPGERPLRTLVGRRALQPFNELAVQLQQQMFAAYGIADLVTESH